jgi:hypothetical protein
MYYIAYGSNLNREQMAYRCQTAKVVGNAVLHDFQLLFRGYAAHAVATIEKKKGGTVPVLVWDIQPADERALDRYEGWPNFYRKGVLSVSVNGKQVEAMAYIMNGGIPLGTPSRAYLDTILQGYILAGFDTAVLNAAVVLEQ